MIKCAKANFVGLLDFCSFLSNGRASHEALPSGPASSVLRPAHAAASFVHLILCS